MYTKNNITASLKVRGRSRRKDILRRCTLLGALCAIALVYLLVAQAQARDIQPWAATIHHVSDGDTVTVIRSIDGKRYRVRLQGIDAPEIGHGQGRPGQQYGLQSKRAMQQLLSGASIRVMPDGTTSYDRIVGRIFADGRDVAFDLVRLGLAWDYPRFDNALRYVKVQRAAQREGRGIWSQSDPIPPWRWRHQRW